MHSNAYYVASSKLWLARLYLHDLTEYQSGDSNRFGRMVDGKGNSCGSERLWLAHLQTILVRPDVRQFFAAEASAVHCALIALGYHQFKEQPPCPDPAPSALPEVQKTP